MDKQKGSNNSPGDKRKLADLFKDNIESVMGPLPMTKKTKITPSKDHEELLDFNSTQHESKSNLQHMTADSPSPVTPSYHNSDHPSLSPNIIMPSQDDVL